LYVGATVKESAAELARREQRLHTGLPLAVRNARVISGFLHREIVQSSQVSHEVKSI
jgi:hypothetical protein